ncbi:MAG TPA: alcohol dehydrogenase catalytic domain-containing protein [Chloroflexota bacterium]|nr:alcohol dehydrogenase catalytic domain-containing protein [Chloroflexota bacterium]
MSNTVPQSMRAARFLGEGRIAIERRPVPQPGPGEVLVRVHACATCGSDRHAWEHGSPIVPGHEGSGTVVAAGPGATLPLGTRGAVYLVAYCGDCRMCRRGETGACLRKERMIGFTHDGAYAEYLVAPERCVLPIDPEMHLDNANMLLDVLGTTLHAIRRSRIMPEQMTAVCIMGAGPIGQGAIIALRGMGVPAIYAVDINPFRLERAAQLGAQPIDGREGDVVARMRTLVPDGPDFVLEATGNGVAQRQAIDMVAADGPVVVVGHSRHAFEVRSSTDLIAQEKMLIGSEYFGVAEFPQNLALVREGRVDPLPVITHRMSLDAIEEAFRLFWSGMTGKVLVCP